MHYAIQQGQKIDPTDYNPNHGELTCADPQCHAQLKYIPLIRDQNGHVMPAQFISVDRNQHHDQCQAVSHNMMEREPSLTLKQAVLSDHTIILSLNDLFGLPPQLWRDFGVAHRARHLDTPLNQLKKKLRHPITGAKGHRSEAIKSINDLMRVMRLIEKYGGQSALQNTHVTWQHQEMPFDQFVLNNHKSQIDLFKELYKKSRLQMDFLCAANGSEMAYGMPHLLPFVPSSKTVIDFDQAQIQSTNSTMTERSVNGRQIPLFMQHHLHTNRVNDVRILRSSSLILAVPSVISTDVKPTFEKFKAGQATPSWVRMHWSIEGTHQMISAYDSQLPENLKKQQGLLL